MIIAKRKNEVLPLYILTAVIGVAFITLSFFTEIVYVILGIVLLAISAYLLFVFFRTPSVIITLDDEGALHLPNDVTLLPSEIGDVSYRRASAKGIQYKWGSVTLETYSGRYKFSFVAECEDVAKNLLELKYNGKNI